MRWFVEETRCARQVDGSSDAAWRIEGEAHGSPRYGALNHAVRVVEAFTLLPIFGLPFPAGADGSAMVRLYLNGGYVGSMSTATRLPY
jgi:hypothetical protein